MEKHRKHAVAKPSLAIYDEAFRLQVGEYWPEHHQANVKALCEKYPDYSPEEVDVIYRKACNLEPSIEEWLDGMELSSGSRAELLEWLQDHYFGFTQASFLWALKSVEEHRQK